MLSYLSYFPNTKASSSSSGSTFICLSTYLISERSVFHSRATLCSLFFQWKINGNAFRYHQTSISSSCRQSITSRFDKALRPPPPSLHCHVLENFGNEICPLCSSTSYTKHQNTIEQTRVYWRLAEAVKIHAIDLPPSGLRLQAITLAIRI